MQYFNSQFVTCGSDLSLRFWHTESNKGIKNAYAKDMSNLIYIEETPGTPNSYEHFKAEMCEMT